MTPPDTGMTVGETTLRPDPTDRTDAAISKAVESLTHYIDGKSDVLAERVEAHWRLSDERWSAFNRSFTSEKLATQEATTRQDAANEKAIDKSEKGTADKIDKLEQLFKTTTDALRDKIEDVKNTANGSVQQKIGGQENRTATIALIGVAGTVIAIVVGVVSFALANAR